MSGWQCWGYDCSNVNAEWSYDGPSEERALDARDPDCSCGFQALDPACVVHGYLVALADGLVSVE